MCLPSVGGVHHNFERWFNLEDSRIIAETGANVRYTDEPEYIEELLDETDILYLSNNQPLPGDELRQAIFEFVDAGNGLLIGHAAGWYSWGDWPEYYSELVSGGTRSHPPFQEIDFKVVDEDHPITESVPKKFAMSDELYRFENDPEGPEINVLVTGIDPESGDEFPVVWTVDREGGPIVCYTFGHDGTSHTHEAFKMILKNSIEWLSKN